MRLFLFKLTLFFAPILLSLGLVEYGLSRLPTGYEKKRRLLEQHISDARVLVTGSSHAFRAVQPSLFGGVPAYNTAYVNQDIYYDTRIVLRYLPRAANLRLVMVSVSYFSFEVVTEDSIAAQRVPFYTRFWDIPPATPGPRAADYSFIALHGAERTRTLLWNGFHSREGEDIDPLGHAALPHRNVSAVQSGAVAITRHHGNMKAANVQKTVHWMEEMLDALQSRGVAVVLITTPVSPSYRERIDPAALHRMQDAIEHLRREYGLEYRDYSADPRFAFRDFADSDHLADRGAEKFSLILKDEIVSRYIR